MKAPHFWSHGLDPKSREAAPLTRALLTPLEQIYIWGVRRKLARTTPHPAPVPVICVGNLTVGGVGKTPVVAALRDKLTSMGYRTATLSRGYGGKLVGPLRVDETQHTAVEVGDEPLMLACSGESWIGRDRPAAAEAMAASGVQVIIMDDGFQNPGLEKTFSLLAIDAAAPFGNGYCLPKGPLREPIHDGMARADALLLIGEGELHAGCTSTGKPILRAAITPRGPAPHAPLVAFAGIGRPRKVFDSLIAAGADLRDGVGFGDHYVYTARDMTFLRQLAREHEARLITTEKDFVRLPQAWRDGILSWPVEARFHDATVSIDTLMQSAIDTFHHAK
ncbi:MAG: tetraacyldisaccharide 4'-kinase [Hyphomonadaceae bacterium]|nr:tetraacyldisaccharide 4'-kinase [Hyphomonadaceae bacterium]